MKNIHILPTNKTSSLYFEHNNSELIFLKGYFVHKNFDIKPQNIYITSDEEIKEGDWVKLFVKHIDKEWIHKITKEDLLLYTDFNNEGAKIILTTDQDLIKNGVQAIDDEFLEWFVKNPSCEKVEVVKGFADGTSYGYNFLDYKIIIPKEEHKQEDCSCTDKCLGYLTKTCERIEEPKQETLEEAAAKYARGWGEYDDKKAFIKGAKWQQERMYNEEEVLNFTQTIIQQYKLGNTNIEQLDLLKETLQQFKNK